MRHNRVSYRGILNHCYQNTIDGKLIFYTESDFLVYFTVFCTIVPKYRVKILGLCLMYDHVHKAIIAESTKGVYAFSQNVAS